MKRKGLTIRKKIIAIIMFISVLIISIGFIFEISKDVRWLKRDLLNNARLNTRLIGEYTVSPLFFHDKEGAKEVISKLQAIPNFMSVKLYNHDKELFASFSTSLDTFIVETIKTSPSYEFHRNYLVVQEPVYYDGNLYGIIVTKISTAPMYAEIKSLLFIILGILAALLLLAYILASHFQKIISTPILKLASVTQEITDKADYSIRLQHPVKDEIGQLYDGFNNMLSQLQKREIERDKAEKNLKEAKERAEQADKLKTAFLSNMSHEIRTPMNSIIGFSSLMAEEDLTPGKKKEYAELITNSGNSLLNLVDDIIDIAKIEAEQIRINKTECNISIIMNEIYVSYNEKMNLGRKNDVELIFNRNNFHDNLTIKTDPYRFRQVLSNLLSNAIKFTDKGFVEFGIEDINQDKITFFVRDTGIGLSDDKKNLVFDRFRKIEDNKTKLYRG
ncbi:MAG: histidine kinase dimerization/phospho-acceptor domain-containing protein, partial [bacterium]